MNNPGSHNNLITVTKADFALSISCTEGAEGAAKTFDYKDLGGQFTVYMYYFLNWLVPTWLWYVTVITKECKGERELSVQIF